jgi:serine/threonine protein kinase
MASGSSATANNNHTSGGGGNGSGLTPPSGGGGSGSGSSHSHSVHNSILRIETKSDVYKKYEVLESLGSGSMGNLEKVRLRRDKIGGSAFNPRRKGLMGSLKKTLHNLGMSPNTKAYSPRFSEDVSWDEDDYCYALKSIHLDKVSPLFLEELRNEIEILRSIDHPNVVKALEVFASRKQIYMVLELCSGGDLYTRSPYSEREAARIVTMIVSAVSYLHEMSIVHRDLKFENIMFENSDPAAEIKIIDFGLSKKFGSAKPGFMTDRVGTM